MYWLQKGFEDGIASNINLCITCLSNYGNLMKTAYLFSCLGGLRYASENTLPTEECPRTK